MTVFRANIVEGMGHATRDEDPCSFSSFHGAPCCFDQEGSFQKEIEELSLQRFCFLAIKHFPLFTPMRIEPLLGQGGPATVVNPYAFGRGAPILRVCPSTSSISISRIPHGLSVGGSVIFTAFPRYS